MLNEDQTLITSNKYSVELAKTEYELRQAQSLRYKVFNVELEEGLERSHNHQLDVDKYDAQCDHLLVRERKTDTVIGTYRMQTHAQAQNHHGFYTADEFQMAEIPQEVLKNSVEVGRACIHRDHRNGRVLYLLWRGIAKYMQTYNARYLLGCCSLKSTDPKQGWIMMDYLQHNGHIHSQYRIRATADYNCPPADRQPDAWKRVEPPQLFRLYLDLGAKVLSKPALDKDFKTIDYLIIVDVEELDEQTRALFFK